ncbi:MAG: metallophosphoesterase [Dysgonomonas sp.]|nr:metallophosphoesterase [Dysgonomonas sp.]
MKQYIFLLIALFYGGCLSSCTKETPPSVLKMGIFSDPHYLSEQLMDKGIAIENYDKISGKAVREVPFVLQQVIDDYLTNDIEILLIPGDITKDGEKQSHMDFVKKLQPLLQKGVKVFVIPGNHDINIPKSLGYKGESTYPTENITPNEFADIYADCGYKDALKRDSASLSYIAELNDNTWLLAIDVSRYQEYTTRSISGGRLLPATEQWIKEVMEDARLANKQVIGMMHHGLVEHIMMQSSFFPEYIVEDWQRIASLFADLGVKAVFTGHFHANDITEFTSQSGNKIYDIETGSLSAYPFPYRYIEMNPDGLKITTKNITSTPSSPHLAEENKILMQEKARQIAKQKIHARGMNLPENTLSLITDIISQVFVMHLEGDEVIDDNLRKSIQELSTELDSPIDASNQLFGIDLYPADNNVEIKF